MRFEVRPADVSESQHPGEAPQATARRLAREKALCVAHRVGERPERWVLGADTLVVIDGETLGKPDDAAHAARMLARLVGRAHSVVTGVALASSRGLDVRDFAVESRVRMRGVDAAEIEAYVATGESLDKAGGYAFQGGARRFVEAVEGSETNVIGLPVEETLALLRELGLVA